VIQSFGDQTTRDVWDGVSNARTRKLPPEVLQKAPRKLDLLHAAASIDDLRAPPGNRVELLVGNHKGFHSIRINVQWRIIFRWTNAGPADVEIIDYHR
jgi:proteic killer suppression protein